jgi:regulator of RNase E activity RraA
MPLPGGRFASKFSDKEGKTMNKEVREKLMGVSAATIATALFKRGFRHQMIQDVLPLSAKGRNMVGPAYTLRYIPAREDLNPITVFQEPSHPQRAGVEECPPGHVFVIDSRKDPSAASAGSILVNRLMARACEGIVTDGGFRDSPEIAELDIRSYHNRPSAPTNLTSHQAIETQTPIGCGDAPVFPGDIIVGDDEGVIVIPAHLADEIADEAVEMTAYEDFVTEQVKAGATIVGLYPATKEENLELFAKWRQANGR